MSGRGLVTSTDVDWVVVVIAEAGHDRVNGADGQQPTESAGSCGCTSALLWLTNLSASSSATRTTRSPAVVSLSASHWPCR